MKVIKKAKYNQLPIDGVLCPKTNKYQSTNDCSGCKYLRAYSRDHEGNEWVKCTHPITEIKVHKETDKDFMDRIMNRY